MIQKLVLLVSINFLSFNVYAFSKQEITEYLNQHFDVAGYVGYRYIFSPDSQAKPSPVDSGLELGLLVNYNITDNWTAFTQLRFDHVNPAETVAYAHVEYSNTFFNNLLPVTVKVGKLRHQYGLYNKDRLNPRTRQGVVMPQSIYWDQLRFAITSGYGFSIATHWNNKFHFKYTAYAPVIVDELDEAIIWTSGRHTTIESNFNHHLINIDYTDDTWRMAGSIMIQDWGDGQFRKNVIYNAGIEKKWDKFTFALEGIYVSKADSDGLGYSATIAYDINELWSVHTNYNYYKARFKEQPIVISNGNDDFFNSAHDTSIGVTFHKDNWEVRADLHAAQGSVWVDFNKALNPEYSDTWYYGAFSVVYHWE